MALSFGKAGQQLLMHMEKGHNRHNGAKVGTPVPASTAKAGDTTAHTVSKAWPRGKGLRMLTSMSCRTELFQVLVQMADSFQMVRSGCLWLSTATRLFTCGQMWTAH